MHPSFYGGLLLAYGIYACKFNIFETKLLGWAIIAAAVGLEFAFWLRTRRLRREAHEASYNEGWENRPPHRPYPGGEAAHW